MGVSENVPKSVGDECRGSASEMSPGLLCRPDCPLSERCYVRQHTEHLLHTRQDTRRPRRKSLRRILNKEAPLHVFSADFQFLFI